MVYYLFDGVLYHVASDPIAWDASAKMANVRTVHGSDALTDKQMRIMCGGAIPAMVVGMCYRGHCATLCDVVPVLAPINAGQMAPLSADVSGLGVCDGGD